MLADLVVINKDPISCNDDELQAIGVEEVYIGGKLIYSVEKLVS
jgi:predicted amidohydrolase YtcJ